MSQKIKFTTLLISIWRWVHCMFRAHLIKFLLTKPCSGKQQLRLRQQSVTQLCHYLDSTKPHGNKSVRKKTRTLWNLRTVDVGSSSADVRKAQKYSTVCLVIMLKITRYSLLLFMHWYSLHFYFVSSLFPNLVHTESLKFTENQTSRNISFQWLYHASYLLQIMKWEWMQRVALSSLYLSMAWIRTWDVGNFTSYTKRWSHHDRKTKL